MTRPYRSQPQSSAKVRARGQAARRPRWSILKKLQRATAGCLFLLALSSLPSHAEPPRPVVGEDYIFNSIADGGNETSSQAELSSPGTLLRLEIAQTVPNSDEIASPGSRAWAGAQAVQLTHGHPRIHLADDVLAATGDGAAAAASRTDGSLLLFGLKTPCSPAMPSGHPAFALGLSRAGGTLAAWAPGRAEVVLFDLFAPGCPASSLRAELEGQVSLTLSPSGSFVAAHDSSGALWAGPRQPQGAEASLRRMGALSGKPAALGFSQGEGVLIAVDAQGRGSVWNPRSGKVLRGFSVPGGPFVRGEIALDEARLWTAEGTLVRWDMLRNTAAGMVSDDGSDDDSDNDSDATPGVDSEDIPKVDATAENEGKGGSGQTARLAEGWLELRGTALFYVGKGRQWRATPLYELPQVQAGLSLSRSASAQCLRLTDVDGQVRYYSSRSGAPALQCFADDWAAVPISADGTAKVVGLVLRVFTPLTGPGTSGQASSQVNARAISHRKVVFWAAETRGNTHGNAQGDAGAVGNQNQVLLESVAEGARPLAGPLSIPLRKGLAEQEPPRMVRVGK